jgi:protoporphyrinogen oxidase
VARVAAGLEYRDFITVGLLLRRLQKTPGAIPGSAINLVPDNWIYIQDQGVQVGRLQFFNNWSPYLVADPQTVWIGMEYFCRGGDSLWSRTDGDLLELGIAELEKLGLAHRADLLDGLVLRVPKAYPGYYGSYGQFSTIRDYTDSIPNLFLIGRNGMHRYNNQDHSMLTARLAVEAILADSPDKRALWDVNIDDDYHEAVTTPGKEALS